MFRRGSFLVLWLALLVCAPLPFFLLEVGREPVVGIVQLLGVTVALIATEGPGGAAPTVAFVLTAQVLLATAALAGVAWLLERILDRLFGPNRRAATLVLVAVALVVACTQAIYVTPFRTAGLHSTLPEVFE